MSHAHALLAAPAPRRLPLWTAPVLEGFCIQEIPVPFSYVLLSPFELELPLSILYFPI